jgi:REP element-mobilizing transposase RayT
MIPKSKYDPLIHHRRSIRLKRYDYSSTGAYFVTICLQTRFRFLFGNVKNGIMILNDAGSMVDKWYRKLESKFPDIQCREYAIMPNHFHCIIENTSTTRKTQQSIKPIEKPGKKPVEKPVGADPRVCPGCEPMGSYPSVTTNAENMGENVGVLGCLLGEHLGLLGEHMGSPNRLSWGVIHGAEPVTFDGHDLDQFDQHIGILGEHKCSPLSAVIQWFKTMTTNEYIRNVKTNGWPPFERKLWQRNYYEHIVRSDKEFIHIQNYIINNPIVWGRNKEYFVKNIKSNQLE